MQLVSQDILNKGSICTVTGIIVPHSILYYSLGQ